MGAIHKIDWHNLRGRATDDAERGIALDARTAAQSI